MSLRSWWMWENSSTERRSEAGSRKTAATVSGTVRVMSLGLTDQSLESKRSFSQTRGNHCGGPRLVKVRSTEKLSDGLSVGTCRRRAVGGDPPQDAGPHGALASSGSRGGPVMCRPLSGRRRAGTSSGTLVEGNGVLGSAEAQSEIRMKTFRRPKSPRLGGGPTWGTGNGKASLGIGGRQSQSHYSFDCFFLCLLHRRVCMGTKASGLWCLLSRMALVGTLAAREALVLVSAKA